MLDKIQEIRQAVKNGTYIAALALALTLPDICSQVENHASAGTGSMYVSWVNKHMDYNSFQFPLGGFENQEFGGEMCYSLRCRVLHNGDLDIKNPPKGVSIDSFVLTKPGDSCYYHGYRYETKENNGTTVLKTIIGIDYLCEQLCNTAEEFYNYWANKNDFNDCIFAGN